MPKRNRKILKESFSQGRKPSADDFENLIDSTINILDDGLSKRAETGIGLAPIHGKDMVLSVYRDPSDDQSTWEMAVDSETGDLILGRHSSEARSPLLTLLHDGGVALGEPGQPIRLQGTLQIESREGNFCRGAVPANGKWHDVTEPLEGCWALEVTAGCGQPGSGRHALLVATAVHCFGSKTRIRKISSHYGRWGNKIRIRWVRRGLNCGLQMKTVFDYGSPVQIQYSITKLWDNR